MDKSRKILIIVATVFVIIGVYLFLNQQKITSTINSQINTATKSLVGDEYAGWQTYTNQVYGYTIRYPKGFHIVTTDSDKTYSKDGLGGLTKISNYYYPDSSTVLKETDMSMSYFFVKIDPHVSPDVFIDKASSQLKQFEKFNLNGNPALRYREINYDNKGVSFDYIMSINDGRMYSFTYLYLNSAPLSSRQLADKIGRSIAFTKH